MPGELDYLLDPDMYSQAAKELLGMYKNALSGANPPPAHLDANRIPSPQEMAAQQALQQQQQEQLQVIRPEQARFQNLQKRIAIR